MSKAQARKVTIVLAKFDVGLGNRMFLRGDGPALDWNIGALMDCIAADEWIWSTDKVERDFACKFLINDETWSVPDNISIKADQKTVCLPNFA